MLPLDPVDESPLNPFVDRLVASVFVAAAVVFVAVLLGVDPDPRGHGTHEQLDMTPCGWAEAGYPCPTCGVTTAACHLVHLRPDRALVVSPFGATLTVFCLWLAAVAARCLFRRLSFLDYLMQLPQARILTWGTVLLFLSWGYVWLTWDGGQA
jgi:hypothetical protein